MQLSTRDIQPRIGIAVSEIPVLCPSGRFDAHQAPHIRAWMEERTGRGMHHLIVDLSDVTFVDSAALAVLVSGMKRCRSAGGELVLCGLRSPVRIIFELTRMDRAFQIMTDTDSARCFFIQGA